MEPTHSNPNRSTPPKNLGLLKLIRAKREWTWRPSLEELKRGFRGWHQRGHLPHFDAPGVMQFVTFVLADVFPAARRVEWEPLLKEAHGSAKRRQLEQWLDCSRGACWLRQPNVAELVEQILLEADGHDYRLLAWAIMPNHVHLLVSVWDVPLVPLINLWKGKSAREANKLLNRSGRFWFPDYFDTLVRDEEHCGKAIRYTEQNPVRAFLVQTARDWPFSSARRRDEYERLPWQREGT